MTTISIDMHDQICQDLHRQIRKLIVENEELRSAMASLQDQNTELDDMLVAMERTVTRLAKQEQA